MFDDVMYQMGGRGFREEARKKKIILKDFWRALGRRVEVPESH